MKILMLITQLGYGGAERAFVRLARALARMHSVDIALFVEGYGTAGYSDVGLPRDLPIHRLDIAPTRGRLSRWMRRRRRLADLKRSLDADVTISFLTGPNLLNGLTPGPGLKVVSVRGSRIHDHQAGSIQRWFYRWVVDPVSYRLADAIVCVSRGLAMEIGGAKAGRPNSKVQAISGYVDAEQLISKAGNTVEPEVAALAGTPLIVTAGRLSREKGFHHLIRVFAGVRSEVPDARLLMIGDGPCRSSLEQACGEHGLTFGPPGTDGPDIIFTGFREAPHRYFRLAKAFVLPSSGEGFPNILVEALASAVPVVAADVPWGSREVLAIPPDEFNRPFPRSKACETPYGYLLPRIDQRRFERPWIELLARLIVAPPPTPADVAVRLERVRALDCGIAAQHWEALLTGLRQARAKPCPERLIGKGK